MLYVCIPILLLPCPYIVQALTADAPTQMGVKLLFESAFDPEHGRSSYFELRQCYEVHFCHAQSTAILDRGFLTMQYGLTYLA